MNVRMSQQILAPRVKYTKETDLGAQVRGVSCDRSKGLGCSAEEDIVDRRFVLIGDGGHLMWHGEDHVEIFGIERASCETTLACGNIRLCGMICEAPASSCGRASCETTLACGNI